MFLFQTWTLIIPPSYIYARTRHNLNLPSYRSHDFYQPLHTYSVRRRVLLSAALAYRRRRVSLLKVFNVSLFIVYVSTSCSSYASRPHRNTFRFTRRFYLDRIVDNILLSVDNKGFVCTIVLTILW